LTGPVFDWLDAPRFVTVLPEPTVHGRRLVAVLFHWKSKLISLHFLVFWLLALWHQCAICASLLHGKCALCHSVGRTTRHAFAYSNSYNLGKSKLSVPFIFITSTFLLSVAASLQFDTLGDPVMYTGRVASLF
jgi:hypothetical protein